MSGPPPDLELEVTSVLYLIEDLELPHPSAALLRSFVTGAVNRTDAARYVRSRLSADEARLLVSDWTYIIGCLTENGTPPPSPDAQACSAITRRDGEKCCITGMPGTRKDPLVVVPILPCPSGWITDQDRIVEMLGVFFGQVYRDWWLAVAKHPEKMSPYSTHWLVRKSAAQTFAQGMVGLVRLHPSMIEYKVHQEFIGTGHPIEIHGQYPLLGDHSRSGIHKVDARFVGTQLRFCRSIQFFELAKETAPEILSESLRLSRGCPPLPLQPPIWRQWKFSLSQLLPMRVFLRIWLLLPGRLRLSTYNKLLEFGRRLYRHGRSAEVHRLPFGLYLRHGSGLDSTRNEFNALKLVRQHTSVPVPEPLDLIGLPPYPNDPFKEDHAYLLTTRLPGTPLAYCEDMLSDRDFEHVAAQMKDYLAQLRTIPKTVNPDMAICNVSGECCIDPRLSGWNPVGPFPDEAAFSQLMRFPDDPARRGHKIVFSHGDLNPRNILVDRFVRPDGSRGWRVTGIVDWETAGFYPEYWDYTKAMFEGFRWTKRYNRLVKTIFSALGDYSKELQIEQQSWAMGDGI